MGITGAVFQLLYRRRGARQLVAFPGRNVERLYALRLMRRDLAKRWQRGTFAHRLL